MGLFDEMLKSGESLFLDPMVLDFDYQPKLVPHREEKQHYIANCIKPLFQKRNGKNLIIQGAPGVGKTVCLRHVLREIEQTTDEINCIYFNCWKKESPFKIVTQICEDLGYTWVHNKSYEELYKKAIELLNKKSAVFVFDEADRISDQKIIYSLLEDVFRKVVILITNREELSKELDQRVKSRLLADNLVFEPYKQNQIKDILEQRKEFAFVKNVWEQKAFDTIILETFSSKDIRKGLHLMKSAGENAEGRGSKKIEYKDVEKSLEGEKPKIKEVNEECDEILDLIRNNKRASIKELFEKYGKGSYRTFQRRIKELQDSKQINIKEINNGFEDGRTNEVEIITLDDF